MLPPRKQVCNDTVALQVPCDLSRIRAAAEMLEGFLERHHCAPREIMDCKLALVEACNNAIQYAAPEARHLPVLLHASCAPSVVEIRVTDHTSGFEWHRPSLPNHEAEAGRGLFIIGRLMDECHYERGTAENTLVLRKRRSSYEARESL